MAAPVLPRLVLTRTMTEAIEKERMRMILHCGMSTVFFPL